MAISFVVLVTLVSCRNEAKKMSGFEKKQLLSAEDDDTRAISWRLSSADFGLGISGGG